MSLFVLQCSGFQIEMDSFREANCLYRFGFSIVHHRRCFLWEFQRLFLVESSEWLLEFLCWLVSTDCQFFVCWLHDLLLLIWHPNQVSYCLPSQVYSACLSYYAHVRFESFWWRLEQIAARFIVKLYLHFESQNFSLDCLCPIDCSEALQILPPDKLRMLSLIFQSVPENFYCLEHSLDHRSSCS